MELNLTGTVAAVTGGSKGIGYAIADGFAAEGADVAICARGKENLVEAKDEIERSHGVDCLAIQADLTERADASTFIDDCVSHFGQLDVLVNNAGSAPGGLLEELDEADWYKAVDLKMMGHVRCMTEAMPHLLDSEGSVVNIAGNSGIDARPFSLTSSAVNAADINVTRTLAKYYGRKGVRINGIAPGPVLTDRYRNLLETMTDQYSMSYETAKRMVECTIPLGRICRPEQVAHTAVFLASEKAGFINGETIQLDGAHQVDLYEFELIETMYELWHSAE